MSAARQPALLALEDGTVFVGTSIGAEGTQTGEVVFNTAMTGYQEILTDPSYCGQIVVMTYPLIGNYGINHEDLEAGGPFVHGLVVRELARRSSNFRADTDLATYLRDTRVVAIEGIDTRALTRRIRLHGAMRAAIATGHTDRESCVDLARCAPAMTGADLVARVAPREARAWSEGLDPRYHVPRGPAQTARHVVAIDCGMKRNILRHLVDCGCCVRVVPPTWQASRVLDAKPDGVFVSNGPGDPAAVGYAVELLRGLLGRVPLFGICLGHQFLALALGARTFKLKFGHHGANHPVLNTVTGRVEITSQNHGFAVDPASLGPCGGIPTHVNLNDRTLEGFIHGDWPILAVQYHPEAGPGPHDASYLFDCFMRMMDSGRAPSAAQMAEAQDALQHRVTGRAAAPAAP